MKATRICSIDGCARKHEARGFCAKHYQRFKKTSEFDAPACSMDGCEKPVHSRGWCGAHYQRWHATGKAEGRRRQRASCSVENCGKDASAHQLCATHLARLERTGTTDAYVPVIQRFDLFVPAAGLGECQEWLGPRNNRNYGKIGLLYAHRVACERAHGPAPSVDAVVLHSCDNPPCVNPDHLRWGTQSENMRDMYAKGRHPKGWAKS